MAIYQFVSLFSPCQIKQGEKLCWVKEGFGWAWADNINWWAYELTYDPDIVNGVMCDISDVIYSYGFESFVSQDDVKEWRKELDQERELPTIEEMVGILE